MNPQSFLASVLGAHGYAALSKASAKVDGLSEALAPRAVWSFLDVVSRIGYEGQLPGVPDVTVSLTKSENCNYSGSVTINNEPYLFKNQPLVHVASAVALAIGITASAFDADSKDLEALGRNIDMLVKSRTVAEIREAAGLAKASAMGAGPAATPMAPEAPAAPVSVQTKKQKKKKSDMAVTRVSSATVSTTPTATPAGGSALKLSEAESKRFCPVCGERSFKNGQYTGCTCFSALAKSVSTQVTNTGYTISFGDLDDDAIEAITEIFRG